MATAFNKAPLEAWQVEVLRFTVFTEASGGVGERDYWKEVVGVEPDRRVESRGTGTRLDEGAYRETHLILSQALGRIDWLLAPVPSEETEVATIGSLTNAQEVLRTLMERFVSIGPGAVRLAWGTTLLLPVRDRILGYEQLGAYMPSVQIDPQHSSDFLYQINRRRNSQYGGAINRLSKWSVASIQKLQFQLQIPVMQAGSVMGTSSALGPEVYACRLELDVNTVPEPEMKISREEVLKRFIELSDAGLEIARDGDIP